MYFAIDSHVSTVELRLSPDGTEAEAKAWCEHRAKFKVIFSGDQEQLATAKHLNGIEF